MVRALLLLLFVTAVAAEEGKEIERMVAALVRDLFERFGRRVIVTDRFAVAVDSPLRRRAVRIAHELGLRMQTHLNEQVREKRFVEETLYPDAGSYANVYERDGRHLAVGRR